MKENYLSHSRKETTTRQPNSLHYVLHNVAKKNREKCLKECNNLSRNSVLSILEYQYLSIQYLQHYINKSKLTMIPDLHR